jgi:chemotaxis signal transduction protein
MGASAERVGVISLRSAERGERFVWVFDFGLLAARRPNVRNGTGQVVIVRSGGVEFGLLVDDVLSIASFNAESISTTPVGGETGVHVVDRIIRVSQDVLVQVVNASQLLVRLDAKNVPDDDQLIEEPGAVVPVSGIRPGVQLSRYEEPARKVA